MSPLDKEMGWLWRRDFIQTEAHVQSQENDILKTEKKIMRERVGDIVLKVLKKKVRTINVVMKALSQRFMKEQ